jgi:glycosyltransferase involved in cell wall biosynthesis
MRLVTVGSFVWPYPLTDNQRDWRVLQALREDWSEIHVLVKAGTSRFRQWSGEGVTCHYLSTLWSGPLGSGIFVVRAISRLVRLHRQSPVDLLSASDPVSALAGVVVKWLVGVPLLVHVQGELVNPPAAYGGRLRRAAIDAVTRWVCRQADAVRVVHEGQVRAISAAGVREDRIRVATSRCDTAQYDPRRWQVEGEHLRRSLEVTDGTVAVYVGSLLRGKGLEVALRAWHALRDDLAGGRFLVVGDGDHRLELEQLTDQLGLADMVRFVGAVPSDEVAPYLAAADVFLFPSFSEGSPRAVLEAMSMELPVIASRVGGIPELITSGETGLLVPAGDVAAMVEALEDVVGRPERRTALGQAARQVACQRFDFMPAMRRLRGLYLQTAQRKR